MQNEELAKELAVEDAATGALQWLEQLADRFEGEWPNTSKHCRIHVNNLRTALATRPTGGSGDRAAALSELIASTADEYFTCASCKQFKDCQSAFGETWQVGIGCADWEPDKWPAF